MITGLYFGWANFIIANKTDDWVTYENNCWEDFQNL